jgi:hypothetical protein
MHGQEELLGSALRFPATDRAAAEGTGGNPVIEMLVDTEGILLAQPQVVVDVGPGPVFEQVVGGDHPIVANRCSVKLAPSVREQRKQFARCEYPAA